MDRQTNMPPGLTAAFGAVGQLVERWCLHPKIILELQEERLLPGVAAKDKGPVTQGQGGVTESGDMVGGGGWLCIPPPFPNTHFVMSCTAFFSTSPRGHVVLFSCAGK